VTIDGRRELLGSDRTWRALIDALDSVQARHGSEAFRRSFYGTFDARSSRVADPGTVSLLGFLYNLVRSTGAVQVLETGTARGVSAACMACAVHDRPGGRVVTIDVDPEPDRLELWGMLPASVRDCIEEIRGDSLAVLPAISGGFDLALLDSCHDGPHVLEEFSHVRGLVRPRSTIVIHDADQPGVAGTLLTIESMGYNVVRLWGHSSRAPLDDGLGLALVENRQRADGAGAPPLLAS
jgi:predicted O-methyltransferase YrrM